MSGRLMLCATPIGNMGDITLRAIEELKACDIVAAEDTRCAGILLQHLGIQKKMISFHEHNVMGARERLAELLEEGKNIVLVSDAGMPGISDPGAEMAAYAAEKGYEVTVLPGASAGICGLVLSGLDASRYCFYGFLPVKGEERRALLEDIKSQKITVVMYEAPHRLEKTLNDLLEVLGDRKISLARELTKFYEEVERTTISAAIAEIPEKAPRGEYVLIIEGAPEMAEADGNDAEKVIGDLMEKGLGTKAAAKEAARLLGLSSRDAYNIALKVRGDKK